MYARDVLAPLPPESLLLVSGEENLYPLIYLQVRFCRYRFCPTGELKYRGAVGLGYRSTYKRTLFV
jgi:hypothetical protein